VTDIHKKTKTRQKPDKTENEIRKSVKNQSRRRAQSNGFADPKSSHDDGSKPSSYDVKKVVEGPRKESECIDQENEDNANNINIVNTVSSTVNAASTNEVNVVGENISIELQSDQKMHALEDYSIFEFSSDNKDDGAVADMNNLDTIIQVSPIPTTKIHKNHPLNQCDWRFAISYTNKKDVKEFRGTWIEEEVYVCQPPGFEDPNFPDRVYKVEKTLYGLHQAPRACLLVQVYVDYIIFGSTKKELCIKFEKLMHEKFQMSSMGELTFFLGLQLKQKKDGIFISQDKYVAKILKKLGFTKVKTASTPMETQKPMLKDKDGEEVDVHMYRSMIGSLMYLTSSRPDIMFTVCACARYQVNPKVSHLQAVKRIFSDYARASLDRKSTTGGCQFLGYRLISWQCKKQTVGAYSTTKAKYVATSSCCGQVLWIQNQLLDYGYALTANPTIYVSYIEQFWSTAKSKTINGEVQLHVMVDGNKIIIIDSSIRRDLQLEDEEGVDYEVVHKERGDRLVRAVTTASSLEAEQNSGNINKTQSKATPNEPSSPRTSSGADLGEDASKQGMRISAIDDDDEITLVSHDVDVNDADDEVFVKDVNEGVNVVEEEVEVVNAATSASAAATKITATTIPTVEDYTLAQALADLKSAKPKVKGVVIQELSESTTTKSSQQPQDKGKEILIKPVKPLKKNDQIRADEEVAQRLQAEFDEEARLAKENANKEQEANITLIAEWDDI
ncbi:uncharacterized mitochondrial protein-like protein, partial [Tanacetum coccineum]